MKNKFMSLMLLFMATFLLFSCEKYNENDEADDGNKEANSTLTVRTRAEATEGNGEISYPVSIYVFNSNNKCVEVTKIESEGNPVSLKLPEGSYYVYAIAGADENNYDLPTKEDATKETVISLKSGMSHGDIMTATNNVTLAYGETNTLTLSLSRKVMLVETVTINNVPSNVTAVSVEISPLYKDILLNGEYSEETDGTQKIELTKEADGSTWKKAYNTYLLEASGHATIKVSFTTANSINSYSYSCAEDLKANHKINIDGTYNGGDLTISGTITGAEWEDPINITFNFDESGSTTEENPDGDNNDGTGDTANGDVPEVGTLYKDCYVLKSEQAGNETVVTLVSKKAKSGLVFTDNDTQSIKDAIENGIKEIANNEIEGWRLPTIEELKYIKENSASIVGKLPEGADNLITNQFYFYSKADGSISLYHPDNDTETTPSSGKKSQTLRAFTTITFTK